MFIAAIVFSGLIISYPVIKFKRAIHESMARVMQVTARAAH
jgi:hypothetical protein